MQLSFLQLHEARDIFVNFKDLYYENGQKLPFAAAQIGSAYRNEVCNTFSHFMLIMCIFQIEVAWQTLFRFLN